MRNHLKILCLLISMFIPQSALTADKHALLIAVQDYSKTPFRSLKGPANDLKLTEDVLRKRFGFQHDDFIIIKDAQATHTGIENAFKALIKRVQSDDFVYIYYSGHGSQTADLNGDEPNGKDQTWVSYGSRTSTEQHKDNYDVLDDEINAWLAALYAKTDQVVFVSDSCHSATVSRGQALIRSVKEDTRSHILGKLTYTQPTTRHGIRVGAARDYESAIEELGENGQHYGLFTWHWVQNLQQAQAGNTWSDVFKRTYAQVTAKHGIAQQPQMEGERARLVLKDGFTPLPATIPVYIDSEYKERVKILVGSLAGVTEGSVYRLYKPQSPNPQKLPSLTIERVTHFASYGKNKPDDAFKTGDLVIEESHVYSFPSIKVYLDAEGDDKALLQVIQSAFQPSSNGRQPIPAYALTDEPSHADLRLHLLRPKRVNGQFIRERVNDVLPKSFSDQPPELWVLTPEQLLYENLQIRFDDPSKGVKLLQDNLNKLARIRELKALQSRHGSTFPVMVQTFIRSPDQSCQKGAKGANCVRFPEPYSSWGWFRQRGPYRLQDIDGLSIRPHKGDLLTFTLHNQSEQDYYCYLINITPGGAIYAIFPDPWEQVEYARINAGKTRILMEEVVLPMSESGENTIKVIISASPIDVSLLEQSRFERTNLNPLEKLLVNAVYGLRGYGAIRNDQWATEQVTVEVE